MFVEAAGIEAFLKGYESSRSRLYNTNTVSLRKKKKLLAS